MAKKKQKEIKATKNQWTFAADFVKNRSMLGAFDAAYPKHAEKPMYRKRSLAKRIFGQKGTQLAIQELTNDARTAEKLTIESHMHRLKRVADAAFEDGKWASALKAEELMGKASGFYVERSMNVNVTSSPDQIKSQMEALLEQHPQMASLLGMESPRILVGEQPPQLAIESQSDQACSPSGTETGTGTEAPIEVIEPTETPQDPQ